MLKVLTVVLLMLCLVASAAMARVLPDAVITDQEMESILKQKQPVEKLLELVQLFRNKSQFEQAVRLTEKLLKEEQDSNDLLLKGAYLHYRLGWLYAANKEERKRHYYKFFDLAKRATQINPDDYYSQLLLAAAKSKKVRYLSNGEQVRLAREMAEDLRRLLARDGENIEALYLASWLNFEIGRVPALKKMMALMVFGGLPEDMTVQNGFALLKGLIRQRPGYVVYQYDLGIFYLRTGQQDKGQLQFEKVVAMKPMTTEGAVYQEWGRWRLRRMAK